MSIESATRINVGERVIVDAAVTVTGSIIMVLLLTSTTLRGHPLSM